MWVVTMSESGMNQERRDCYWIINVSFLNKRYNKTVWEIIDKLIIK